MSSRASSSRSRRSSVSLRPADLLGLRLQLLVLGAQLLALLRQLLGLRCELLVLLRELLALRAQLVGLGPYVVERGLEAVAQRDNHVDRHRAHADVGHGRAKLAHSSRR